MYYNVKDIIPYVENYKFGEYFSTADEDFLISAIDCENTPDFDWNDGASKLVIIPFDTDYVIKIPFNSNHYNTLDEDYYEFFGENYCLTECELYNRIEREYPQFAQFFLPLTPIDEFKEWDIYIQLKCKSYTSTEEEYRETTYSKKSVDKVKSNNCVKNGPFPKDWIAAVTEVLQDIHLVEEFINMLYKYNIHTDMHCGNFGYCNGKPVIFDYGGFDD